MGCSWRIRWWHKRLRRLDRELLIPSMIAIASQRQVLLPPGEIYRIIRREPNMEHWNCPCGLAEEPIEVTNETKSKE